MLSSSLPQCISKQHAIAVFNTSPQQCIQAESAASQGQVSPTQALLAAMLKTGQTDSCFSMSPFWASWHRKQRKDYAC